MAQPEKLNLFDRFFNRYREEVYERGIVKSTEFYRYPDGTIVPNSEVETEYPYLEYFITDRLTGSETIKRVYL